jgi:(E)-4-hydroxy-3-methyl-but-2-enyl pyrophosphate reductase
MDVPIDQVQAGDIVFVSAHGNPRYLKEAQDKGAEVYDGTCIFVHSTHKEILTCAEDAARDGLRTGIVYLSLEGRDDHPELRGTVDFAQDQGLDVVVVKSESDIADLTNQEGPLRDWDRLRIISQTTNDADRAEAVAEQIVQEVTNSQLAVDAEAYDYKRSDVCRTVTDRQAAVKEMIQQGVETLVVVGSLKSKNTVNLVHVAEAEARRLYRDGVHPRLQRVVMVNSHAQLPRDIKGRVGVASGASTDDDNVDAVVRFLNGAQVNEVGNSDRLRHGDVFPPVKTTGNPANQERLKQLIRRYS